MSHPRASRPEPGLYQPDRNPPSGKFPPVAGSMAPYNPSQYNPGYPPSNGSWNSSRQPPVPQQQQPPPPVGANSSGWDENVNNFSSYPEVNLATPLDFKRQNEFLLRSDGPVYPSSFLPANYSPEPPVNNNQFESQPQSGNQNWGWNDGDDWGWSGDFQQPQNHQQVPLVPPAGQVENQPMNFHSNAPPPTTQASGLETGFSSLSLSGPGPEQVSQIQDRPPFNHQQQQQMGSAPTEDSNSSTWSRVPTWGSALDSEQASLDPGTELSYPRELGERNTLADGASFTDPSQASTSTSVGNGAIYTPSLAPPNIMDQPTPSPYLSGRPMPPPTGTTLSEMTRSSPSPHLGAQQEHQELTLESNTSIETGTITYPIASSPSVAATRMSSVPPNSFGDGYNNGPGPIPVQNVVPYSSSESAGGVPPGMPTVVPDLPIGNRLPGSGSRSQSGTPSMERENERPDAEGGYENDQPTPLFAQPPTASYAAMADRKVAQESPAGSRPSSRQAGSTPSSEIPTTNPSPYHLPGEVNPFARPKPVSGATNFYPPVTTTHAPTVSSQPAAPTVARGSQEAVGSEFGPPLSTAPLSRADGMTTPSSILPPSSQRMIPGSGSQGPPLLSMAPMQQQLQPPPQTRPTGAITPVSEQRIVTGFAKSDPVPAPLTGPTAPLVVATSQQGPPSLQQSEEVRGQSLNRSPPPPHRSETIGSENPRANQNTGPVPTSGTVGGSGPADRSDDRISNDRDRDREIRPHDRGSRVDRDRDRDDYDRDGRNRYPDDDEDERFSTSFRERDRRYDGDRDRDREHRDTRRYDDRDRGYSRADYDDDRRSGYGPSDRDRNRDGRRREPRRCSRSDYYLMEAEMYERSGGRRSSLYEGDNNDPASEFNRSAYGFNTSRDGRRRDNDRSRIDDRYYSRDRPGADVPERAHSERDYRHGGTSGRRRDPRDMYYQDPRYYGYSRDAAYDPYRSGGYPSTAAAAAAYLQYYNQQMDYALKYNYPYFEEMRLKNPAAYSEWYQRNYAQRYAPTVATGTGTALGSMAASEADRGSSVHSGRSSVNEDHPSMLANHSISQQLRGSTTGLDQSHAYDYNSLYQEENLMTVQDMTPHKFSCPHVVTRFSPGGILLRVLPNNPKDGVAAHVELHDLNVLLGDLPTALEMKFFPGPLVPGQTHKQQVAVFCQQKIRRATEDPGQLVDRQSYILLWELLLLLLRQNGTIVGTDIAELLLKDHEILREPVVQSLKPEQSETGETGAAVVAADRTLVSRQTEASVTRRFRELLLFGNKKEALEWAMTQGLWGHALFLASKLDARTYSSVMIRFANGLALTDPLQTLYQLMSGRQPTAVTSCGDDKWSDWRPHLAMILSNSTTRTNSSSSDLDKKSIVTLGDTLGARGFPLAAHFCYLVAQVEFGSYSNKASKLVLLSSSNSLAFDAFATNEAIQCTEVYEYARQLAAPEFNIPSFQAYKFLYATRLAEHGRAVEALQYCEAVGNVLARCPSSYAPSLIDQVYQLGSMLKYSDPQYLTENDGALFADPAWLTGLEAAVKTAQSDFQLASSEQPVFEQTTDPESLPPADYSSYQNASQQIQQQQQQYGDQQYGEQQYGDQQTSFNTQQPAFYYDPNAGQQMNFEEQQQQQVLGSSEPESFQYSANSLQQEYNSYGSSQYNANYSLQPPQQQQQQQQQQQPWNYGEANATNGVVTHYLNPSNNNLKDTNRHRASRCVPPEELKESDPLDAEEELTEGAETGAVETADLTSSSSSKRVVFGGTFPIDRPMSLNFAATAGTGRSRQQPTSLTLKTPRTFSIDEPIHEDHSAENPTPAEEDPATGSYAETSYYNPSPSSSTAPNEAKNSTEAKSTGGKQESSNKSKSAAAKAQQAGSGGSWLGGFFSKFKPKTQMNLPDDKNPTIVWDPVKNQWVNTAESDEDNNKNAGPPPKDASFQSLPPAPLTPAFTSTTPTPFTANTNNNNNEGNRFGLNKGRGGRGGRNYVNPSHIPITSTSSPLPLLDTFPAVTPLPSVPQFFVPSPAPVDPSAPSDFVSSPTTDTSSSAQVPDEGGERFMYNPTQLAPPMPSAGGRPGLASRGRYPR